MTTQTKEDHAPFYVIGMLMIAALVIGVGLMIIKDEIASIKFIDRDLMCQRHGMTYKYTRIDLCVDDKGQLWDMWAITKGEPIPTK